MALLPFNWSYDDKEVKRGPGVDRPRDGERCKEYRLIIQFGDAKPMTWIVMAPSAKKAKSYAKARWPHCNPVLAK
jgi:hypothetical protein